MLGHASNEIEKNDSVIKNNIILMTFIVIISLLNFGVVLLNITFLLIAGFIIINYKVKWNKMKTTSKYMLAGLSCFVNSISLFIIGYVLADIENKVLALFIIVFYVFEYIVVIYFTLKPIKEKNNIPINGIKYPTSILVSCSSLGLILSRYLERKVSDDIELTFASFALIGLSYIFVLGVRFIVFPLKQVTEQSGKN